ncbi:helix-turn-helix domain-containing protein [Lentzea sp. NPDC042327]|uniref:winged helix-turn-helix transcriptional regulator n=1 Tax=Lentzea sp. NPDC042327 TaxID=3154801 RepID=UPI0033F55C68
MAPRTCSVANALEVVGERWSLLALREVFFGNHRFDQIAANTGASRDVLTARLKKLVACGVLERRQYSEHPPRHEYVLTESGRALNNVLLMLKEWGDTYVTKGPLPLVWEHSCGNVLEPLVVCAHCGREATPESLTRAATTPGDPISAT